MTALGVEPAPDRGYGCPVRFVPGSPIVLREVWEGRVFEARPTIVVRDEPELAMFFTPGGVACGLPIADDGRELRLPDRAWRLEVRRRGPQPIISFAWPETPYAVLLWAADGRDRVWYVNLQRPFARTAIGFDTTDHALDAVIPIDGSSWRWKDEDELADAVARGLFSEEDAAGFRVWGERAVERVLRRDAPFDRDWTRWEPDPSWPTPDLPAGWDVVGAPTHDLEPADP